MTAPRVGPPVPTAGGGRAGKYELLELLGKGGMGEVWRARDPELGREVALKLLQRTSPEDLARFRREARLAAQLNHPHIAQVYEVGDDPPYLAMQVIDGRPLHDPSLPLDRRLRALAAAARAVHHAHAQGILHRDLKPQNILVDREGRPYVLDFGLAREVKSDATAMSLTGDILGTPSFMAPEQARGCVNELDVRTDVYGLGATLYALLAGRPPHTGPSAVDVLRRVIDEEPISPGAGRDLDTIALKALAKDPARRYATAEALADDIERYLRREPIRARPPSLAYRLQRRIQRHPVTWALGSLLVLALVGGASFGLFQLLRALTAERKVGQEQALRLRVDERFALARDRVGLFEATQRTSPDPEQVRRRADDAIETLDRVLELDVAHYGAGVLKARTLLALDRSAEAVAILDACVSIHPDQPSAYFYRGLHHIQAYALKLQPASFGGSLWGTSLEPQRVVEDAEAMEHKRRATNDFDRLARLWDGDDQRFIAAAYLDFVEGRFKEARAGFARALTIRPDEAAKFHYLSGLSALFGGDADAALGDFENCKALFPTSFDARWALAKTRQIRWELDAALAEYDGALAIWPAHRRLRVNRAWLLREIGRFDDAIAACRALLDEDPADVRAVNVLGVCLMVSGRSDDAIAVFERAIGDHPDADPVLYANLAEELHRRDRRPEAEAVAARGIERFQNNMALYSRRATAREALGNLEGALADIERIGELSPGDPVALRGRAALLRKLGRDDEASAVREELLRLAETSSEAAVQAAEFTSNPEERLGWLDRAVELSPRNWQARHARAGLLLDRRRPREALADVEELLSRRPREPAFLVLRGRARLLLGECEAALADARGALAARPSAAAEQILGTALLWGGKPREALEAFDRVRGAADPIVPAYRALAMRRAGDAEGARRAYADAVAADPELPAKLMAAGREGFDAGLFAAASWPLEALVELEERPDPAAEDLLRRARAAARGDF